jgi:pimeloyl-ACP methyl ester carboxylesterase
VIPTAHRKSCLLPLVFALVAAWLLPVAARADDTAATCTEGTQPGGALYRICVPDNWNGELLVYAHGYVAPNQPIALPTDEIAAGADVITGFGYAYATTSYRRNGLAVAEAQEDLLELVDLFVAAHSQPTRVWLAGASEGALITTLLVERRTDVFSGGLAVCGPYGDFRGQVDYYTDFRVLYDHFFPKATFPPAEIPNSPIDIKPDLLDTWETTTYSTTVKPIIEASENVTRLNQLLATAGAAVDPADAATKERTVERLLWYNVYATNDGKAQLGGQPYDNNDRTYAGSDDDTALNAGVERFTADDAALTNIARNYETTGRLCAPLVTLHTTLDPVVPYWQAERYGEKVTAAGSAACLQQTPIVRYGHCTFQPLEVLAAFNALRGMSCACQVFLPTISRE